MARMGCWCSGRSDSVFVNSLIRQFGDSGRNGPKEARSRAYIAPFSRKVSMLPIKPGLETGAIEASVSFPGKGEAREITPIFTRRPKPRPGACREPGRSFRHGGRRSQHRAARPLMAPVSRPSASPSRPALARSMGKHLQRPFLAARIGALRTGSGEVVGDRRKSAPGLETGAIEASVSFPGKGEAREITPIFTRRPKPRPAPRARSSARARRAPA